MHYVTSTYCYAYLISKSRSIELMTFPTTVKWSPLYSPKVSAINRYLTGTTIVANKSLTEIDLKM